MAEKPRSCVAATYEVLGRLGGHFPIYDWPSPVVATMLIAQVRPQSSRASLRQTYIFLVFLGFSAFVDMFGFDARPPCLGSLFVLARLCLF